jgi:hypothetical protein
VFELEPSHNEAAEALDGRSLRARRLTLPLVYVVIAVGIGALWALRRRPGAGPLLLAAVVFPLSALVSVAAPRLRAPFDLACCIAIGVLVSDLATRQTLVPLPARWRPRAGSSAAAGQPAAPSRNLE